LTFDFAQISLNFLFSNKLKLKGLKLEVMRNKGPSLYKEERIKEKKIKKNGHWSHAATPSQPHATLG